MIKLFFLPLLLLVSNPCFAAIDFDGTDDFVSVGARGSLFDSDSFSVCAWIKTAGSPPDYIFSDYNSSGSTSSFALALDGSNRARFFWENPNPTAPQAIGTTVLSDNNWHHLCGTWNGTTRTVYVDGVSEGTNATAQTRSDVGGVAAIGRPGAFDGLYFDGIIDDVRFYNDALTAAEVKSLFESKLRGTFIGRSLGAYWTVNDGPDGTSADGDRIISTTGINHGTGDDGAGNANLTWVGASPLSYPPNIQ